ncbi:MAG: amino acid ABC transporter ATP-binding protein [Acidimicrobiales bacterium]
MTAQNAEVTLTSDIRFEQVSKSFGARKILDDINLTIPSGTTTCLIGPSGSGKTTLLRCVNRLETPDSGRIYVGSIEVTDPHISLSQVRSEIGIVFQNFNLFPHLSAADNVSLGLRVVRGWPQSQATEEALRQLERVGLRQFAAARPLQLSGGQQQRVAIARALAMKPRALLFDEPTSALDPELVHEVLEVMEDLSREEITLIVATHEMRFAQRVADSVVFLDGGQIVEQGPPQQLLTSPASPRLKAFLSRVNL